MSDDARIEMGVNIVKLKINKLQEMWEIVDGMQRFPFNGSVYPNSLEFIKCTAEDIEHYTHRQDIQDWKKHDVDDGGLSFFYCPKPVTDRDITPYPISLLSRNKTDEFKGGYWIPMLFWDEYPQLKCNQHIFNCLTNCHNMPNEVAFKITGYCGNKYYVDIKLKNHRPFLNSKGLDNDKTESISKTGLKRKRDECDDLCMNLEGEPPSKKMRIENESKKKVDDNQTHKQHE